MLQKSQTRRTSVNRSLITHSTGSVVQQQCPPADAAANNISFGDHCYNTTESPRKLKRRLDETTDRLDDTKRAQTERRTAKKKVNNLQTVTRTVVTNVTEK